MLPYFVNIIKMRYFSKTASTRQVGRKLGATPVGFRSLGYGNKNSNYLNMVTSDSQLQVSNSKLFLEGQNIKKWELGGGVTAMLSSY